MPTLEIVNLHANVEGKEILKGVNLKVSTNETVALLGPNGHGKSTLLAVIMGNPRLYSNRRQSIVRRTRCFSNVC